MGLWKRIASWNKDDKGYKVETSKKGENYFSVLKVDDEVVMTIISPPTGFSIDTTIGVEGGASAISASGGVNVSRDKAATYDKPIVLFNKDNAAGLQMQNTLTDVKTKLEEVDPEQRKFEVDPGKLNQDDVEIIDEKSVTIGSTIVDMQEKEVVLRPNFKIPLELKETLGLCLEYMIKSLNYSNGHFRANVMLFNPITKKLKIVASYNMSGYKDETLEIDYDQGGAGNAFTANKIELVDLYMKNHKEFNIDPDDVWSDMLSIISVPIKDEDDNPIGVINIDTDIPYTDAKFHETRLHNLLRMLSQIFTKMLEGYILPFT